LLGEKELKENEEIGGKKERIDEEKWEVIDR
jgi:hypothetical protein